jgi:hypothetical protein
MYPSEREGSELTSVEIKELNERLQSNFEKGWYMGHTRRWLINKSKVLLALKLLAEFSGWSLETTNTP